MKGADGFGHSLEMRKGGGIIEGAMVEENPKEEKEKK